jgi:DNA-binding Lrp family transcriptional regulator
MTKINLSQTESRVLRTLFEDSRQNVNEIARVTNLNRNTVRTAIKSLITNGVITRFTVNISPPEDEKMVLLEIDNLEQVPEEDRIEVLELANGKYVVLSDLNLLKKSIKYSNVNIVKKRQNFDNIATNVRVYCDYCGKEINEGILTLKHKNHEYYVCCENCKGDLNKKLTRSEK